MKKTLIIFGLIIGLFAIPFVITANDICDQEFTYTKTNDFSDSKISINFIMVHTSYPIYGIYDNKMKISINVTPEYEIIKVELDVRYGEYSGFYQYSSGPLNNFDPEPGDIINSARVTVKKICLMPVEGCIDSKALNYNPEAEIDDESCEYKSEPSPEPKPKPEPKPEPKLEPEPVPTPRPGGRQRKIVKESQDRTEVKEDTKETFNETNRIELLKTIIKIIQELINLYQQILSNL